MIKVKLGKGALMFKEGTSDEEINKKLLEYSQFQVRTVSSTHSFKL